MKFVTLLITVACAALEAAGYPYYPYYGNMDSMSLGASDSSRGGIALSRYYNPYYPRTVSGGMAAFMFRPEEEQQQTNPQPSPQQYYLPDRRLQTQPDPNLIPPQQNEVFYPQQPEDPIATKATEIAEPTEKTEVFSTTLRTVEPELTEPEVEDVEEPVQKPKKRVSKRKQVKRPVDDEEEDEYVPKMPASAFFPMFFGWGGRSSGGGAPGGATAIANAYSTGRGGVASSHATAYGTPQIEARKAL